MTKEKKRDSNIELLRIISMIMIVFHHFAIHGGFNFTNTDISINHFWYNFMLLGGKLGVNIFVLISGYFLVTNKKISFDLKHIFKFILQLLFYSIVIFIFFNIFDGDITINFDNFKKIFLPIIFGKWWFASAYFILYLLHPFINKMLINLEKKEYKTLIGILIVCFSIIPTLFDVSFQGNNLIWFICLYCIAGYIKIFGINEKIKAKHYILLSTILFIGTYLTSICSVILGTRWETFRGYITYFYSQNAINMLLLSICIFLGFKKLKIKYNKIINLIASATFGVYLIHDEPLVRNFLWKILFTNYNYQESSMLIEYSLVVCLIVFIVCTIIELLRQTIIEKPLMNLLRKIYIVFQKNLHKKL